MMKVVRVEKRRSRVGDKHHMRLMSRGKPFDPNKVVGATITISGDNPEDLRNHHKVQPLLRKEESKLGLFASMLTFRSVYKSMKPPHKWEAQWDIR